MIPHVMQQTKTTSAAQKLLTVRLYGALVHGRGCYGFFTTGEYPKGGNINITVLMNILYLERENLPTVLNLQFDNAGENKCQNLLAFLCLLIELKIFDQINVNFLMTG